MNGDRSFLSERAYAIWEKSGCPEGTALEDWLRAEAELAAAPAVQQKSDLPARTPKNGRRHKNVQAV
jgi:hypothetical protein